jgi:predicted ATPase/DNA-binding CsgD family transcriptional regulator
MTADWFPPLRSLESVPNNLPGSLSSFIGRFEEIATVARLVGDNRLVTLVGSGGAGKTRLAQQVAAEVTESYPDGVWWVDLLGVDEPGLVPSAISRAALLPEDRADRLAGLARRLGASRALLVLDNCEHLLDGCADVVSTVLSACPSVAVLTTSRAPLSVPGEVSWRVPPLSLPDVAASHEPVEVLSQYDAVRLFTDRTTEARQNFRLTEDNVAEVVEICARLDGIPLAIELAAARCRVLTPRQILDGLSDALGLLAGGPRVVRPRHQTIEASIKWSHSLLNEDEQALLRRLSVFSAPFTLDAAEAVAGAEPLDPQQVLVLLEHLVDQSLVHMDDTGAEARFGVLETVRQFADRELSAAGETDATVARHADHFAERARGLWPFFEENMRELLERSDTEFEDLRRMLLYLGQHASPQEHAEVAMACLPGMAVRHVAESAALGDRVAARVDSLSVLGGHLHMRLALVDPTDPSHIQRLLAAAEATGDPEVGAYAAYMGSWFAAQGDPGPDALSRFDDAFQGLLEVGETHFSKAFWTRGALHRCLGRHEEAVRYWERGARETVCLRCSVMVFSEGALLGLDRGDLGAAEAALARAEALGVEVRDAGFQAYARLVGTRLAAWRGKALPVSEIETELASALATNNQMAVGHLSEALALVELGEGRFDAADTAVARALEIVDPSLTETRLLHATIRHAQGDFAGAGGILDALRHDADRWDAGPWLLSQIDHRAAALALDRGDVADADDLSHRALAEAAGETLFPPLVVDALELIVSVAVARESLVEAARLCGAASRFRDGTGYRRRHDPERGRLAPAVETTREGLGDGDFDAAFDEGRRLSSTDAVAYARRARGERKRPSHGWDGLTPTERQVADLCVQGLTNAQIAEQLFIGRETVKTHLSNVYAKVGVANRTQLVADAARRDQITSTRST